MMFWFPGPGVAEIQVCLGCGRMSGAGRRWEYRKYLVTVDAAGGEGRGRSMAGSSGLRA